MLRILGSRKQFCDGITRRDMLWAGGLGMFGLGLSDYLRLGQAQAAPAAASVAPANSISTPPLTRNSRPAMIADRISATLRAIPSRRLSSGASGAIAPKQRTGIVSSNPAVAPDSRRPELIWWTSGPTFLDWEQCSA